MTTGNSVNILVNADTKGAEGGFGRIRKAVMAVSLAVAGMSAVLVKIGDEIKTSQRTIQATTGATGAELAALNKEFKDIAGSVPQDWDVVAKAMSDVHVELGITGDSLEDATKKFLDLARVTGSDVGPIIDSVTDSMGLFGMSGDQASFAMDKFAKAAQITGAPIADLSSRAVEFGPVLRNMGFGLDDSIALLGQLEGAGIDASRVMPGLNASMRKMAASGTQDLGEGLYEAMRAIRGATGETEALNMATDLFGAEGAQRMKVAIQDGIVDIEELSETLADSTGTVDDMTEGTLTAAETWAIWTSKMKLAVGPLAEVMAGIGPIVIILPSLLAGIAAVSGAISGMSLAAMGASIKTAALTVATAVQTAASWLGAAAASALNLALSPIGLIIIGIVVAIAAVILIWKNWDTITRVFLETWEKLDSFLSDKFPATWAFIKDYISTVIEFWKEIFQGFVALFKGDWDGAIEHFKGAFSVVFDFFKEIFDKIWGFFDDWMTSKFGAGWETLKGIVSGVVDAVGSIFEGLWNTIKGIWDLVVALFTGNTDDLSSGFRVAIETIRGIFQGFWTYLSGLWQLIVVLFSGDTDKIKEGFKGMVNGIIEMFNAMIRMVNKIGFSLPDWLGGKSFNLDVPEIPKLAEGGIVNRPTLAMIGEGGPEAVVPLNRGGGLGGGVTVNVMMPEGGTVIMDDEQTMQRFSDFITREIRQVLRTQAGF